MHLHLLGGSTAQRPESSQQMRRGFYRSSTGKWYIPEGVKSSGACQKDSRSGGMKSEVKATNGAYRLSFDIPAQLAPLSLAFELQTAGSVELSRAGQRFSVPIGMSAGRTTRLGESCSLMLILHTLPSAPFSPAAMQQHFGHGNCYLCEAWCGKGARCAKVRSQCTDSALAPCALALPAAVHNQH